MSVVTSADVDVEMKMEMECSEGDRLAIRGSCLIVKTTPQRRQQTWECTSVWSTEYVPSTQLSCCGPYFGMPAEP